MSKVKLLETTARFEIYRNDMFWSACVLDSDNMEFFHLKWTGYNDDNWWRNVADKYSIKEFIGDKGTHRWFRIDYHTNKVTEVVSNEKE